MALQQLLGIELPIIQAPMAGVQDSALAIAVSNAGGLGSLPCAMLSLDRLRAELSKIKSESDKPFNVNFFCHRPPAQSAQRETAWRKLLAPYYEEFGVDPDKIAQAPMRSAFSFEAAEVLEEFEAPVVSFHFGLPSRELLAKVKSWGAKILSSATTVEEAIWLEERGVDAIIAQGIEAGGHRAMFLSDDASTQIGTLALLPRILHVVKVPVIAAGGIADAKGVAAVRMLGAAGAQLGTAYLLCPEATTSPVHRAALQSSAAGKTVLTNLFSGRPARSIVNRLIRELGPMHSAIPEFPLAAGALAPLRANSESRGSGDFSPLWAGQNTSGCKPISAASLTREVAADPN